MGKVRGRGKRMDIVGWRKNSLDLMNERRGRRGRRGER